MQCSDIQCIGHGSIPPIRHKRFSIGGGGRAAKAALNKFFKAPSHHLNSPKAGSAALELLLNVFYMCTLVPLRMVSKNNRVGAAYMHFTLVKSRNKQWTSAHMP